ncbi:MAG TPA: MotA/TolQ/ExbB proton channel family protein [Kofleriaceae bacterium]|nr:MotA/TolQ/ExbB proton channel family protein [Kofleriaceae bacterium]
MNTDTDTSIDATLLDILLRAGSHWVLWLLIVLSLLAIMVIGERLWFYIENRKHADKLRVMLSMLRDKGAEPAIKQLAGDRSMEATVARACLERAVQGVESVEEHRQAAIEAERTRYEKRLVFLGTLGANAPFVGLFGTVLGIIRSFHDLAGGGLQNTSLVMAGIGEALVATAVGLVVAIPAVATYNAFTRHVETSTSASESLAHEILAVLKARKPAEVSKEA